MTLVEALAWADKTLNQRMAESSRVTGNSRDYYEKQDECIDALSAEIRRRDARTCETCHNRNDDGRIMAGLHYCHVLKVAMPDGQFCARWAVKGGVK